jgi:hypothetical protein
MTELDLMIDKVKVAGICGSLPEGSYRRMALAIALPASLISDQVAIANAGEVFDVAGACRDAGIEKRLKSLGGAVAKFASLHNSEHAREFLRLWESAPSNPGGEDR